MVGGYADRTPYDLCERVFTRGQGWHCKTIEATPDVLLTNDQLARGGCLLLAAIVFLWWCARWGKENGEKHGPEL